MFNRKPPVQGELKRKRHIQGEQGSVAIEFGLMFPIFLIIIFGAYEIGIYLHNKQVVTNAVREAARYGVAMRSPRPTPEQIQDKFAQSTQNILIAFNLNCVVGGPCTAVEVDKANENSGTPLTVSVNAAYPFPLLTSLVNFPSVPLWAQSVMVLE